LDHAEEGAVLVRVLLFLLMDSDATLVSRALRLLFRVFRQHRELLTTFDGMQLLTLRADADLFVDARTKVDELRQLVEKSEEWLLRETRDAAPGTAAPVDPRYDQVEAILAFLRYVRLARVRVCAQRGWLASERGRSGGLAEGGVLAASAQLQVRLQGAQDPAAQLGRARAGPCAAPPALRQQRQVASTRLLAHSRAHSRARPPDASLGRGRA
jgi:hypothetical protein